MTKISEKGEENEENKNFYFISDNYFTLFYM